MVVAPRRGCIWHRRRRCRRDAHSAVHGGGHGHRQALAAEFGGGGGHAVPAGFAEGGIASLKPSAVVTTPSFLAHLLPCLSPTAERGSTTLGRANLPAFVEITAPDQIQRDSSRGSGRVVDLLVGQPAQVTANASFSRGEVGAWRCFLPGIRLNGAACFSVGFAGRAAAPTRQRLLTSWGTVASTGRRRGRSRRPGRSAPRPC